MLILVRITGDFGNREFEYEYDEDTIFEDINIDIPRLSYEELQKMEEGSFDFIPSVSYSMLFHNWDRAMPEITPDMYIQKYIDYVGGNMRARINGILNIVISKRKINSKIHDLF